MILHHCVWAVQELENPCRDSAKDEAGDYEQPSADDAIMFEEDIIQWISHTEGFIRIMEQAVECLVAI